jgi:hypothetical protein
MSTSEQWPEIRYEQARTAYEAGQKLHLSGRTYLVRPVPREGEPGPVLWVTDERTTGDHGMLLFPDSRVEYK